MKRTPFFIMLLMLFLVASCSSDEPDPIGTGEEEFITTVTITLTPKAGGQDIVGVFRDNERDGVDPMIGLLTVKANTAYEGSVGLFDNVNNLDLTPVIKDEGTMHQFWYSKSGNAGNRLSVSIKDDDDRSRPLGFNFDLSVSSGGADTATLKVVLSHYENVNKDGFIMGDQTDFEATFDVEITAN